MNCLRVWGILGGGILCAAGEACQGPTPSLGLEDALDPFVLSPGEHEATVHPGIGVRSYLQTRCWRIEKHYLNSRHFYRSRKEAGAENYTKVSQDDFACLKVEKLLELVTSSRRDRYLLHDNLPLTEPSHAASGAMISYEELWVFIGSWESQ